MTSSRLLRCPGLAAAKKQAGVSGPPSMSLVRRVEDNTNWVARSKPPSDAREPPRRLRPERADPAAVTNCGAFEDG